MKLGGYKQKHIDSGLITMINGVPHAKVRYLVDEASSCDLEVIREEYFGDLAHKEDFVWDRRAMWRLKASELDAEFCAHVLKHGIGTPVDFWPDARAAYGEAQLGNGHHRVILAYLLGYEYIAVTPHWDESIADSGPTIKDRL